MKNACKWINKVLHKNHLSHHSIYFNIPYHKQIPYCILKTKRHIKYENFKIRQAVNEEIRRKHTNGQLFDQAYGRSHEVGSTFWCHLGNQKRTSEV